MALKQMDWCSWVFAHLDVAIAVGPRQGLSLMDGPHPWNWKEFLLVPINLCGKQLHSSQLFNKGLLSQTGTDLLLSSECPRCGHLAPASIKDS